MKFLFVLIILSTFAFAEEETEFDKFVEKQKKENLSEETRKNLEAKPHFPESKDETKFDKFIDKTLKNERPRRHKGLIDPLIDSAKEASEAGKKKIEEVTGKILRTEDLRADSAFTFTVGYQPFATWIPSRLTGSFSYIRNRHWSYEAEYGRGSLSVPVLGVDLGSIKEERVSTQARYYPGNSFNFSFGLMYQHANANLGGDVPATSGVEAFSMESFGATAGFGNRWQWENGFTFGIDWFRMNQPLFQRWEDQKVLDTVSKNDAEELKKVMRAFNYYPTFVFFGLSVGYTF